MSCSHAEDGASSGIDVVCTLTPAEQAQIAWSCLSSTSTSSPMSWPSIATIGEKVFNTDYSYNLSSKDDFIIDPESNPKILCANGFVATVSIEWFPCHGYTGLFHKADHGIIRLSSALPPLAGILPWFLSNLPWIANNIASAQIFPAVAIKFFRQNHHSGNLLFAGRKYGQKDDYFFKECVSTCITATVSLLLQWIMIFFTKFTRYPTQLGLSDFAGVDESGCLVENSRFPWCVALSTPPDSPLRECRFVDIVNIPSGSVLYDVFAIPSPGAAMDPETVGLQRIGRVVTTSSMKPSGAVDGIHFKHQKKEEDYALMPDWEAQLTNYHNDFGPKFINTALDRGSFLDFEDIS